MLAALTLSLPDWPIYGYTLVGFALLFFAGLSPLVADILKEAIFFGWHAGFCALSLSIGAIGFLGSGLWIFGVAVAENYHKEGPGLWAFFVIACILYLLIALKILDSVVQVGEDRWSKSRSQKTEEE